MWLSVPGEIALLLAASGQYQSGERGAENIFSVYFSWFNVVKIIESRLPVERCVAEYLSRVFLVRRPKHSKPYAP